MIFRKAGFKPIVKTNPLAILRPVSVKIPKCSTQILLIERKETFISNKQRHESPLSSNSKSINLAALQLFAGKAFDQETRKANGREWEGRRRERGKETKEKRGGREKPLKSSKREGEGSSKDWMREKRIQLAFEKEEGARFMMVTLSRATPYSIIYELTKNEEFSFFFLFFFRASYVIPMCFPLLPPPRSRK